MKYFISFFMVFIIMYLFYLFFVILRNKKFNSKKIRVEENYIISKYKIDLGKVKYKKFLNILALTNSLIFAFSFACTQVISENVFFQIIIGIIVMIPLIIILYDIIGKYYIKKGYEKK